MRPILFLIFIAGTLSTAFGQTFIGEAILPRVEADGFYRILISPKLSPYLNAEFTNLRIYDQHNKEVPYLFQKEIPTYYTQHYTEYEIVEKKQKKNCCTSLTLRNPDNHAINNISLSIKNAEVTKQATLLGSDDRENWFALKQHFVLNNINNLSSASEIKIVDFPLSNYLYYLLQIEDSTSAPLNILSAGYYELNLEEGKYAEIASVKIEKTNTQKKSFLHITFDSTQIADKITLSMSGAPYYLRKAKLHQKKTKRNKKGENESYYDLLTEVELSSKQETVIELPGTQAKDFLISIENEDNPSLEVSSLKVYQLNRYLTAWLKKEDRYELKIGSADFKEPIYDLAFFKDSIPNQPAVISVGAINVVNVKTPSLPTTIFTNRVIIWIAIVFVIIILGFMSIKLIRETTSAKED